MCIDRASMWIMVRGWVLLYSKFVVILVEYLQFNQRLNINNINNTFDYPLINITCIFDDGIDGTMA